MWQEILPEDICHLLSLAKILSTIFCEYDYTHVEDAVTFIVLTGLCIQHVYDDLYQIVADIIMRLSISAGLTDSDIHFGVDNN